MNKICKTAPYPIGAIVNSRSHGTVPTLIRWCQRRWYAAYCKRKGFQYREPWANHTGIIVPCLESIYSIGVGEAVDRGNVVTPWEYYEQEAFYGKRQFRVYAVIGSTGEDGDNAAWNWLRYVKGCGYDYWGLVQMMWKAVRLRTLSTRVQDSRTNFWCTEGVRKAWSISPPAMDVLHDDHPAPMHVEMASGELMSTKPVSLVLIGIYVKRKGR